MWRDAQANKRTGGVDWLAAGWAAALLASIAASWWLILPRQAGRITLTLIFLGFGLFLLARPRMPREAGPGPAAVAAYLVGYVLMFCGVAATGLYFLMP